MRGLPRYVGGNFGLKAAKDHEKPTHPPAKHRQNRARSGSLRSTTGRASADLASDEDFLAKSFTELVLKPVSGEQAAAQERPHVLHPIVGEFPSAVTFVMDYLQLDFNGHRLTSYIWPLVHNEGKERQGAR